MREPVITDADERYLEQIIEDCERILGAGIDIEDVELETNGEVALHLRYRLGPLAASSVGRGTSLLAAHAALRQRLVVDRVALGFRALTTI